MSKIYTIVIGIVLTLIVALLGLLNLSSQDQKISGEVIKIENIDGSKDRNITVAYTFEGKNLTYTSPPTSTSVNVGDNIDVYVRVTGNNIFIALEQGRGAFYKIFIPLSYLLLLGTSYYIFKK
jgi:hypothetical protein